MGEVLVDVAQRRPVRLRMAAVDVAGDLLELVAQVAVLVDVAARDRGDLQVGQAAALVGVALQVTLEALEALRQALGVVQPVHADGQLAPAQALLEVAHRRLGDGLARLPLDQRGVDADREGRGAHARAAGHLHRVGVDDPAAAEQAHVGLEAVHVALGLEAHQVVGVHAGEQPHVVRQRLHQVGRGHRHVQEEADLAAEAAFAQQRTQRDQVVVVHPDGVVLVQHRRQLLGEQRVDLAVALAGGAVVVHQVQAEVQQRPQRAVGEAVVVGVQVRLGQVHGDVADVAVGMLVQAAAGLAARGLAAPAEPQPTAFLQRAQQAHRQPAGTDLAGQGHAVGHHHQPAHEASFQLRDRRIAAMIRPTCE